MYDNEDRFPRVVGGGRFHLDDYIGEGGSGVVFRARGPDGPCAVKLREVPEREILAARFLVEPVPMSRVVHPRVVGVIDTGRDEGFYWIAMQLFEDGTVGDLIKREGRVPVDRSLELAEQTLEGLGAVHRAGFVHRDIKPHNLFLDSDGGVVVGDFGVARHLEAKLWFRTRTGQGIGTMGYRAPEQDNDARSAGPPADVYGVGATLFHLVTGRRPPLLYAADTDPHMLERLPEALRGLVYRMTRLDPADRYASAEEAWRDVRALRNTLRSAEGMPLLPTPREEKGLAAWFRGLFSG